MLIFILTLLLLASTLLSLGSYGVSSAISGKAVEKAIVETDAVGQLTDNILKDKTVNLGGKYGEMMQTVLKSEAMTDFFSEYTARSLQSQIYEEQMEEIGSDDLNAAFSKGMDECIANGSISMNTGERLLFDTALNLAMPSLTKGVNYVLSQMKLTDFVDDDTDKQIEMAQLLTSNEVKYGATGIAIIMCILLIVVCWRSKTGLLICGVAILLVAAFFLLFALLTDQSLKANADSLTLSKQMLAVMLSYGAMSSAAVGAAVGGVLTVACPVARLFSRDKRRYKR